MGAAPGVLTPQQGADLEAVAFDWLLGSDSYLSYPDPHHHKDRVRSRLRCAPWCPPVDHNSCVSISDCR